MKELDLNKLRENIDALDEKIQELIIQRADIAKKIGEFKRQNQEETVYFYPEREAEILKNIIERNIGPLSNEALVKIFTEIISSCRGIQKLPKIAFLGPLGTFSHEATIHFFGSSIELTPTTSIKNIFQIIERNESDYGIVPIENSTEGIINVTLDSLTTTSLKICTEIKLPIHHYLLSRVKDFKKVAKVYGHQQALSQCRVWLEKHIPEATLVSVESSARACKFAVEENNTAAIAGEISLNHYKLNIIAENIEDDPNNTTRFYVLGKQMTKSTGNDKTTLLAWLPHLPGALSKLLNYFSKHDVNLTMIESRPYKHQMWEYIFFLEIEGHQEDQKIKNLFEELTKNKITFKTLGSYPTGIER